jgi:hypothetical protein
MSNEVRTNHYAYPWSAGEVARHGLTFSAWKDAFPIGTYNTFEEAMASLAWKGRTKGHVNALDFMASARRKYRCRLFGKYLRARGDVQRDKAADCVRACENGNRHSYG